MKASEVKTRHTFAVTFGHGDDFMPLLVLAQFCQDNNLRQGYIPISPVVSPLA